MVRRKNDRNVLEICTFYLGKVTTILQVNIYPLITVS